MKQKIASWAIGLITIGVGVWCLDVTSKSALFALSPGGINGMPIDMRITAIVSTGVTVIFSFLFLFSGAASIIRIQKMQVNYSPTLLKVAILILLVVLSVFARTGYEATSKISWEESRGLPFAFLTLTEIRGLCNTGIIFWECRSIYNLNLMAFIIDAIIIYFTVCIGVQTVFELSTLVSEKWLLKNSSEIKVSGG
jgi:hypothetical protein